MYHKDDGRCPVWPSPQYYTVSGDVWCQAGLDAHRTEMGADFDVNIEEVSKPVECGLCAEEIETDEWGSYAEEAGEFWDESKGDSVLAHAQCGLDAGMELA
jgi:hypothetical protein